MQTIYLDNNATTQLDQEVLDAMLPYFNNNFANAASSSHIMGIQANKSVENARFDIAEKLEISSSELTFTSGATESLNIALISIFNLYKTKGNHIITISTEHKAVLDTCKYLETLGAQITYLPVNKEGILDFDLLKKVISKNTVAVCVMLANNETGVIQPIAEIAAIAHSYQAIMISDTTQAFGKMQVSVNDLGIDVAVLSAHKFNGPKGIGAIYARRKNPRVVLQPLLHGGLQDNNLRSGTQNVPAIIGMQKAFESAMNNTWQFATNASKLRTMLEQQLQALNLITINGSIRNRLPNTTNLTFKNITANKFITTFPQIAIATGSACTSALNEPSHVLLAMGLSKEQAQSSIRFSIGKNNTEEQIIDVIKMIKNKLIN